MTATAHFGGRAAAAQPTLPADPGGPSAIFAPERPVDTYSAAEAGRVLGISERRVRQLVDSGKLAGQTDDGPLRLPQEAVHQERNRRRRQARAPHNSTPGGPPPAAPVEVDVERLVERAVKAMLPLMLEPAQRAEQAAHEAHMQERALRLAAEARAGELQVRAELAERRLRERETPSEPSPPPPAEVRPERRWWRRSGS